MGRQRRRAKQEDAGELPPPPAGEEVELDQDACRDGAEERQQAGEERPPRRQQLVPHLPRQELESRRGAGAALDVQKERTPRRRRRDDDVQAQQKRDERQYVVRRHEPVLPPPPSVGAGSLASSFFLFTAVPAGPVDEAEQGAEGRPGDEGGGDPDAAEEAQGGGLRGTCAHQQPRRRSCC